MADPKPGEKYHPAAPTDSDGHAVHPEKGYHICGRVKSDRTTPTDHGRERDDIPYCLMPAGWGADDQSPGSACKNHGGLSGAPEGPRNGNWEHGLYSDYFSEDDAERAQQWVELADGDRLTLEDFVRMGEKALLFEFTRIERAMLQAPAPDMSEKYCCEYCGQQLPSEQILVCPNCETTIKPDNVLTTAEWVDTHDRQISERIERWVEMLKRYKEIVEGADLNVNLGVTFEDAIRRAEKIADADSDEKIEYLVGEDASEHEAWGE